MSGLPVTDSGLQAFRLNDVGEPEPCDVLEWARWLKSGKQQIRLERGEGWYVSTIFTGMVLHPGEQSFWESMAFFADGRESLQERYATRAEALAGHERMVAEAKWRVRNNNEIRDRRTS